MTDHIDEFIDDLSVLKHYNSLISVSIKIYGLIEKWSQRKDDTHE